MAVDGTKLREVVVSAVANAAEISPEEISDGTNLFSLGLDSLNLASILIDIEDGIGAEVPPEVLDRFLDVGDEVTLADVIRILATWDPNKRVSRTPYDPVVVVSGP